MTPNTVHPFTVEGLLHDTIGLMNLMGNTDIAKANKLEDFIPYSKYVSKAIAILRKSAEEDKLDTSYVDVGHDEDHIVRVCRWAIYLGSAHKSRLDLLILAAILHDLVNAPKSDPVRRKSASRLSAEKACALLFDDEADVPEEDRKIVYDAILCHSYSAGVVPSYSESEILQDADRLDSLGWIGVARCLGISGVMGRPLLDMGDPAGVHRQWDDYKYALDHFQTKLFRLPTTMCTDAGRALAALLCERMQDFYDGIVAEVTTLPVPPLVGIQTRDVEYIRAMSVYADFLHRLTNARISAPTLRGLDRRYRRLVKHAAYIGTLDATALRAVIVQRQEFANLLLDVYSTQVTENNTKHFVDCEFLRLCGWSDKK